MSEVVKLEAYQERALMLSLEHRRLNLYLDKGLGKTVVMLSALVARSVLERMGKVLIIMPKYLLDQDTWLNEIRKWEHTKHLTVSKITGNETKRKAAVEAQADVYFVSYTMLVWLCDTYGTYWPFDYVIADESSYLRNHSTIRFKAFKRVHEQTRFYYNLTGSPSPNGIRNLWAPNYMIDQGARLGRNITAFTKRWFTRDYMGFRTVPRPGAQEEVLEAIKDVTISMSKEDYLNMEPMHYVEIPVNLLPSEMKEYKELEKKAVLKLQGSIITGVNAVAVTTKLRQFTGGCVYVCDENGERSDKSIITSVEKINALVSLVEELDSNVIVAYTYVHERERILKALPQAVNLKDVKDVETLWNCGKIPVLLIQSGSGSHGLNLQVGGNKVIWFSPTWNYEDEDQLNSRLHRKGQTKPVMVYRLVCPGTIDRVIYTRLVAKGTTEEFVMDYFKGLKSKYLGLNR